MDILHVSEEEDGEDREASIGLEPKHIQIKKRNRSGKVRKKKRL